MSSDDSRSAEVMDYRYSNVPPRVAEVKDSPDPCAALADTFPWSRDAATLAKVVQKASHTDKVLSTHSYQHIYYKYLQSVVRKKCAGATPQYRKVRLLEIGLGCGTTKGPGGGVKMWRALLTEPLVLELHVMEFAKDCAIKWAKDNPHLVTSPKVNLHFGDQGSPADLERLRKELGSEKFDIIVDDGSHINDHMRKSLMHLFPHVAPGGVYIIEDLHASCSNWKVNWGWGSNGYMPPGQAISTGGSPDCKETVGGEPTMMALITKWMLDLGGRGKSPASDLPGLLNIDVFKESAAFQKEP